MKRITTAIVFLQLLGCLSFGQNQKNKYYIEYEGTPVYINGLNVAWHHFGGDFGNHYLWGSLYDSTWFEKLFTDCENYGVNCVRIWVHTDGRGNPEFDKDGFVKGLDTDFFLDMDDMFRRAKNHNIYVMPCLWSFDMIKDERKNAGKFAGLHQDLITDSLKSQSYVDNVFVPMVKRYKDECSLIAWEVCNEPEWGLTKPDEKIYTWTAGTTVPVKDMQRLTGMMAAAVHKYSDKMVTTGSAMLRWNSDVPPAVENYWSDKALKAAYNDPGAYLDFYQVHYYDYMHDGHFDPFDLNYPFDYWKMDKPCLIGEQPANSWRDTIYGNYEKIVNSFQNNYAGHMFWSYNGYDSLGHFNDFKEATKKFYNEHKDLIAPQYPCKVFKKEKLDIKTSVQSGKVQIEWVCKDHLLLSFYEVEKSSDGKTFSKVKRINPNKNGKPEYIFFEQITAGSTSFYRIKYKDYYGYESFSENLKITN